jgi:internalin A
MFKITTSALFLSAMSFLSCNHATQPDSHIPIANAGPDQVAKVGQYVIIDGSGSTRGDGDTLKYNWTADTNNPDSIWFISWDPKITLGFTKEGIYKFHLVVSNGVADSKLDEVIIIVSPRSQIVFTDPILEINVRYALKNPDGQLTDQELSKLDTLIGGGVFGHISSLGGIDQCPNLQVLNMSLHHLTDISPVAQLKKLIELELDQNRTIVDISPLAGLTNLVKLNLESNNITDISSLRNLTKLKFLGLLGNPVTDISALNNMTELEQLWIGQYGRNIFPLSGTSVISKFTKLNLLWITDCDLTDISFVSTLINLKFLELGFCNLSDITPLTNCTQLERLYMDSNNITDITPLEKLTNLNILDLIYNQIKNTLPLVNNNGLGQGDAVSLTGNPLDSISVNQYIPALVARGVSVYL